MHVFGLGFRLCLLSTMGALVLLVTGVTRADVDTRPLPITVEVAFPNLVWTGWKSTGEDGIATPLRPILVTHAGDGTNRLFVPTQQGVIHVFANDPNVKQSAIFLDLSSKVSYDDKTNEEGFLGLAFPPNYREKGRFFVNTPTPIAPIKMFWRATASARTIRIVPIPIPKRSC
jgi:hypothetical protein